MKTKETEFNFRLSETELNHAKEITKKEKLSEVIRGAVRSKNCECGEKGYEGIFSSIMWKCQKCGKINKWKKG